MWLHFKWRVALCTWHNKCVPIPKPHAEGGCELFWGLLKLQREQNLTYNFTLYLYSIAGLGEIQLKYYHTDNTHLRIYLILKNWNTASHTSRAVFLNMMLDPWNSLLGCQVVLLSFLLSMNQHKSLSGKANFAPLCQHLLLPTASAGEQPHTDPPCWSTNLRERGTINTDPSRSLKVSECLLLLRQSWILI